MKVQGIYTITHVATGRAYVGSSKTCVRRLWVHRHFLELGRHWSIHLQRAWDLYGKEAFKFEVREIVADNTRLLAREQAWIEALRASDPKQGFNLCPVAGTREGSKQPPSYGRRMREVHLGKPKSKAQRKAMSLAALGKVKSAEHRRNLSLSVKRRWRIDPTYRMRVSAALTGRPLSKAHRTKISAAQKGVPKSAETRARMSRAQTGARNNYARFKRGEV